MPIEPKSKQPQLTPLQEEIQNFRDNYLVQPWYVRFFMRIFNWPLASFIVNHDVSKPDAENRVYILKLISLYKTARFKKYWFFKNTGQEINNLVSNFKGHKDFRPYTLGRLGNLPPEVVADIVNYLPTEPEPRAAFMRDCPENTQNRDLDHIDNQNQPVKGKFALFLFRPQEFARQDTLTQALLRHIIRGKASTALEMIKKHPKLLINSSDVTDNSGRHFLGFAQGRPVTALKLALWAGNGALVESIFATVKASTTIDDAEKQEIINALKQQWLDLENAGISYKLYARDPITGALTQKYQTMPDGSPTIKTEAAYDGQEFILPYEDYCNTTNYISRTSDEKNKIWVESIGSAQFMFPLHIVRSFCELYEGDERSDKKEDYLTNSKEWYAPELGLNFAMRLDTYKREQMCTFSDGWGEWEEPRYFDTSAAFPFKEADLTAVGDLHKLKSLYDEGRDDISDFKKELFALDLSREQQNNNEITLAL